MFKPNYFVSGTKATELEDLITLLGELPSIIINYGGIKYQYKGKVCIKKELSSFPTGIPIMEIRGYDPVLKRLNCIYLYDTSREDISVSYGFMYQMEQDHLFTIPAVKDLAVHARKMKTPITWLDNKLVNVIKLDHKREWSSIEFAGENVWKGKYSAFEAVLFGDNQQLHVSDDLLRIGGLVLKPGRVFMPLPHLKNNFISDFDKIQTQLSDKKVGLQFICQKEDECGNTANLHGCQEMKCNEGKFLVVKQQQ